MLRFGELVLDHKNSYRAHNYFIQPQPDYNHLNKQTRSPPRRQYMYNDTMPNDTQQTTHMEPFEDWLRSSTHPSIHKWAEKLIELGASWDTWAFQRDVDETILDLQTAGIPLLAAKDISRVVKEALHRSEVPLSIFWDIENVPIPNEVSGTQVATRLKAILAQHGQLKQFRGYASIGLNHIPEQKRSELQLSGCHLVDCPHAGRKEVADKMIIVDAMEFAFSNSDGATLCFITSDLDYAYMYLLAKLQQRPQCHSGRPLSFRREQCSHCFK